jgi:hypothetical protein
MSLTFREKQLELMADLMDERAAATDSSWIIRLDEKIAALKIALEVV